MGVTGLNKFLKDKYPGVYSYEHISKFAFKKVALDISSYIYMYMSTFGKDRYLQGLLNLIYLFRKYAVNCVPIFDGKAPIEKSEERKERREQRDKQDSNIQELKNSLQNYKNTNIIDNTLQTTINTLRDSGNIRTTRLLSSSSSTSSSSSGTTNSITKLSSVDISIIEDYICKKEKAVIEITTQDINDIKKLFEIFNIPYLQAPDEAETLGCYLVRSNKADAIISLDSDCLAYKAHTIINDLDVKTGEISVINFSNFCQELSFEDADQVTLLCIILGNDYNRHTKKVKNVGPVSGHKLVCQYKTYGEICKNETKFQSEDDGLFYDKCMEIFNKEYPDININMFWNLKINYNNIQSFFKSKNLYYNEYKLKDLWKPPAIVFDTENENNPQKIEEESQAQTEQENVE